MVRIRETENGWCRSRIMIDCKQTGQCIHLTTSANWVEIHPITVLNAFRKFYDPYWSQPQGPKLFIDGNARIIKHTHHWKLLYRRTWCSVRLSMLAQNVCRLIWKPGKLSSGGYLLSAFKSFYKSLIKSRSSEKLALSRHCSNMTNTSRICLQWVLPKKFPASFVPHEAF